MLIDVGLPLSLAIIMFSLGFGLTLADFGRVLSIPKAAITGIVCQVILLPVIAYTALFVVNLPPALAFGVMLLAFCPGGVTTNILTKLAGGNVALSITLTAVVSLLSVLTVPILVSWAAGAFLAEAAPDIDVTGIAITMFAITAVPVIIGMVVRSLATDFAQRTERGVSILATVLFVVIIVAALATNWDLFVANIGTLGPILVVFNIVLLALGVLVSRVMGLTGSDGLSISIEMGVQNGTLGIAVAGLVAQTSGIPEFALPAAVYGITMYIVTIPGMYILRRIFVR